MVQSTVGTNLAATATAAGRKLTHRVVIDWARDGWGLEGSWTDESAYVRSIHIEQSVANTRKDGVAILGNSVAGTATLTLDNSTGRFSPHNAGSAIHAYIQDGLIIGVPVKIYLGFYNGATPERLVQFSGYIVEPSLTTQNGEVSVRLKDRAWDLENARHSTPLYTPGNPTGYTGYPDSYIGKLTELVPVAIRPTTDLDRGLFPMMFAWMDDESIWEELSSVAAAQGGMVWMSKGGVLTFRDATTFALNTTSRHTFTDLQEVAEAWRETDIWNHVVVKWFGGRVARLTELWAQPEIGGVLRPGDSETVKAELNTPAYAVATPVADVDYKAMAYDGAGATADLNISSVAYAQRVNLTLTNNGSKPLYRTLLRLRGWPVDFQDEQMTEAEDSASIGRYGRRTLSIRLLYPQSANQAMAIRDFYLARYKIPRATYRLIARAIPWLEVGDRITATIAKTGYDEDFFIVRLSTDYTAQGGYNHIYELLRCEDLLPHDDWFKVGTTAYGTAGRWFY